MKRLIYADNAATTQLDIEVFEAMKPYLTNEYGNASQPYSFARSSKAALKESREAIAFCIGALPEEIYFTSGGTESDNWAIKSQLFDSAKKNEIITSAFEHHAVLHSCKTLERLGFPVSYMRPTCEGIVTPKTLKCAITDETKLVSVMYVNNEIGTIQPLQELCEVTHSRDCIFHTDAVQAVGHIKMDVKKLGVDMLSASAHKFNGPKGIGFLYVRKGVQISSYVDGGAQENGHRAGTENIASIVGMAAALRRNCDRLEENQRHIKNLEMKLFGLLDAFGIQYVRNGRKNILPGIISLSFPGADGEAILHRMDLMGICISTGSACDSKNTEISHVLKAINLEKDLARGTIRISLGKNNTEDDVKIIVDSLKKIVM